MSDTPRLKRCKGCKRFLPFEEIGKKSHCEPCIEKQLVPGYVLGFGCPSLRRVVMLGVKRSPPQKGRVVVPCECGTEHIVEPLRRRRTRGDHPFKTIDSVETKKKRR